MVWNYFSEEARREREIAQQKKQLFQIIETGTAEDLKNFMNQNAVQKNTSARLFFYDE